MRSMTTTMWTMKIWTTTTVPRQVIIFRTIIFPHYHLSLEHTRNLQDNTPTLSLFFLDRMDTFDTTGLREIGNLASWTVSTFKPGCGVQALRDDDTNQFWQYVSLSSSASSHKIYTYIYIIFILLC